MNTTRKPREQFELFDYDETHNITEWDNAGWICDCPKIKSQEEFFRCPKCKADPPGGDISPQMTDLTIFWEQ